ncbi:MAG: anthranilate phosphoribosyltransferase [Saprospiraceae bacterium]|nr:anthranilate phosphoribosyltransferase [Pyrinomonadaceae bacterium]
MNRPALLDFLEGFRNGEHLPEGEAEQFFDSLLAEQDENLLADILSAWNAKGTSENELYSLASIMRQRAVKVNSRHETFVDAVGTGGSSAKTFNVSTAAAFVIAGAGIPVAKHGNRAATSNSGSADVLSALGVNPAVEAAEAERIFNTIGMCFMFAPNFHKLSPVLAKVRRGLGVPTIFNNLGPLCNPANAPHQIIGVWRKDMVEKTANVLARLGTKKSWIVHGEDGLDEITLNGETHLAEVEENSLRLFRISPKDFEMEPSSLENTRTFSPYESAELIRSILTGKCDVQAAVNLVLINSAAPIYLTGKAATLPDAMKIAKDSLNSGSALGKLNDLIEATN